MPRKFSRSSTSSFLNGGHKCLETMVELSHSFAASGLLSPTGWFSLSFFCWINRFTRRFSVVFIIIISHTLLSPFFFQFLNCFQLFSGYLRVAACQFLGLPPYMVFPEFPDSTPPSAGVDVGVGPSFAWEGPGFCSLRLELARISEELDPLPPWDVSSVIMLWARRRVEYECIAVVFNLVRLEVVCRAPQCKLSV